MAVKVRMNLQVEALGATFHMRPHDGSWARFTKSIAEFAGAAGAAGLEFEGLEFDERLGGEQWALIAAMPAELLEAACDLFVQGCIAWAGVEDEAGNVLLCNFEAKSAMDFEDKLTVAFAYIATMQDIEAKKAEPASSTTGDTLPAE